MSDRHRDAWDKADIILRSVGAFITPMVVAIVGYWGSHILEQKQAFEANVRHYTELMSKREETESALRKDMFVSIIDAFLKPHTASLDAMVLNLELLAYNFHESLNLKPLFTYVNRQIRHSRQASDQNYRSRLDKVAREITRKQMLVLEGVGQKFDRSVALDRIPKAKEGLPLTLDEETLTLDGHERTFRLYALEASSDAQEIKLRLEIITSPRNIDRFTANVAEFWVGFFDFPMIDHTRLSHDQRCAVTLNSFKGNQAEITVVYFPGFYASLKEKAYLPDILGDLRDPTTP
jgi:hypothetical protein